MATLDANTATVRGAAKPPRIASRPVVRMPSRKTWIFWGSVAAGWAILLGLWYWASTQVEPSLLLPGPDAVAKRIVELIRDEGAIYNFGVTLKRMMIGFLIALVLGGTLGILAGRYRYWNAFLSSPLLLCGNTPALAYAVLALLIFGVGGIGPIVAVVMMIVPYVAVEVAAGAREVDGRLIQMSRAYGRNRRQVIWNVVVPSVMPFAFTGARAAFAVSWKVATLTELFGGSAGVGVMVREAYEGFDVAGVMGWLVLFVLFLMAFERLVFQPLQKHLFRWRGDAA